MSTVAVAPSAPPLETTMEILSEAEITSTRFFGHCKVVPVDSTCIRRLSPKITDVVGYIMLNEPENSPWRVVADRMIDWLQMINDPSYNVCEYQLEITNDVLLPYLRKLQGRYSTDSSRSKQIIEILETIMHRNVPHPAVCFQQLDKVLDQVRIANQSYFFSSELLQLLQQSQQKQWRPIVMDLRGFMQDISGKLVGIAVVTIIGWPMVLLSPLLFNMKKITNMVHEFECHRRLSAESTMLLVKIILIMLVLMKLLSILQVYQSIGYLCGGLSVIGIIISSSDNLIKFTAPLIAPNARTFDSLVESLMRLDLRKVGSSLQNSN